MKTSKPISSISYNTIPFLTNKLMELEKKRIISFWMFIPHIKEDDETRNHIHFFCIPNGKINTDSLEKEFEEIDPNNALPLKCIHFRSSKFDDAYMYFLHDESYLISKNQSRKYHYTEDDLVVSDQAYFNEFKHSIDYSKMNGNRIAVIREYVQNKKPFFLMVANGIVPIQQIRQWEIAYNMIYELTWGNIESLTIRGEGETHE